MHQYPSDISREEYKLIREDLEGAKKTTRPRKYDLYDVFCAVLYVIQGGIQWRMLPSDYPKWQSVYYHFRVWSEKDETGVSILDKVLQKLVKQIRNEDLRRDTLPCGSYPFVNLREANTLLRKLFTSRKSEKNVRQHSGTQKGAIEAITSIHTGYMIRAPTFRRSTQRQEPHPLQLNTAAPQNLRSAGTAAFTRGRFFCAAAYADRLLSACRTAADAAERIYSWHFSIAQ